jgi:hypothetical protein
MWKIAKDGEVIVQHPDESVITSIFKSYVSTATEMCVMELRDPDDGIRASITCEPPPSVKNPVPEAASDAPAPVEGEVDAPLAEPPLETPAPGEIEGAPPTG